MRSDAELKKLFDDYIDEVTKGRRHGVNRLDLHELTFKAAYKIGRRDQDKILQSEALLNTSLSRENKLIESWVKHHQKTVEIVTAERHELKAKIKELEDRLSKSESNESDAAEKK